jgi:hypothetical protein
LRREVIVLPRIAEHHFLEPGNVRIDGREGRAEKRFPFRVAVRDVASVEGCDAESHGAKG